MKAVVARGFFFNMVLLCFSQSTWAKQCQSYLSSEIFKSSSLLEREAFFQTQHLQKSPSHLQWGSAKPLERKWLLGQGGEGEAYLVLRDRAKHQRVVHKEFYFTTSGRSSYVHWKNLEGFRALRDFKRQGLLGDLEVVKMYGASEGRLAFYLEYVHGDSLLHLTHRRVDDRGAWNQPRYELRQDMGFKEKEVLQRFDSEMNKIMQAWKDDKSVRMEFMEVEVPIITTAAAAVVVATSSSSSSATSSALKENNTASSGHRAGQQESVETRAYKVVLLIKNARSNETILDLNIMNTVYDLEKDRLVIVDPY